MSVTSAEGPSPRSPSVLFADDDPNICRLLRMLLEDEGYEVQIAEDGAKAIESFVAAQPDLVILDINMPAMNGFEVCEYLMRLPIGKITPILMLTAMDDNHSIERAYQVGAVDYVTKPIQWVVLRHRVRRLIEFKRANEKMYLQGSMLDQVHNAVIATDTRGLITYWNQAAERLFFWTSHEVVGKPLTDYLDQLDAEFPISRRENHEIPVKTTITTLHDAHGRPVGTGYVFVDVLEQYLAIDKGTAELKRVNQELQKEIEERSRIEAELQYRIEFEKLITGISTFFVNLGPSQIDDGIEFALSAIGQFANVDRSYVFLFSDDGLRMNNTHEWCAAGIDPQIRLLQGLPIMIFPWWIEKFDRLDPVYVPKVSELPRAANAERKFFEQRSCKSVIGVPMSYNGKLVGFVGFDSVFAEKNWSDDIIALLKIISELFVNALEHKRAELALAQREQQLRQITDTMLDSVYQTDADGTIIYASPSCLIMLGYSPEELAGQSIYANVHPDDLEDMRRRVETIGQAEYRYRHADGTYIWLETLSNLLFDAESNIQGMVFASRNITERKHAERELQELNRLKTEFLSTAAHELRTPLTSIRGFSEILLTRQLDPERHKRYLKLINEQSTHLGRIIDDLLDISRLEAKRNLSLMFEPVDMAALIRNLAQPFIETSPNHTFQLEFHGAYPLAMADPTRTAQVIKNLLSNAIKYSPQGGQITINIHEVESELQVSISDNGIGLTPDQQAHLFEKFYRADASNTAISGTGLGLAISQLIIELHRGRIWAESEYGVGSTFHFTLPMFNERSQLITAPEGGEHEENPHRG